jgi:hypothetical protein
MFLHNLACLVFIGTALKTQPFATELPADLTAQLDAVCKRLGLRKNFVLETALREKLEDLLNAADLREAINEAIGFHPWEEVKRKSRRAAK